MGECLFWQSAIVLLSVLLFYVMLLTWQMKFSLSLSLSSVPYASAVNVFCIHCVYTARPPYQIGASRQTMVSTTCLFVAAVALLMSITLNCGHWTIRVM